MNEYILNSPVDPLKICDNGAAITEISFRPISADEREENASNPPAQASPLALETARQLSEYFNQTRTIFDLPLAPSGTEFQKEVWNALLKIPYGEIRSYQDIAISVGRPKGCQAVGQANNKNPIAIVIPCHRVIGKKKTLIGYGGGLGKQEFLLELEHAEFLK